MVYHNKFSGYKNIADYCYRFSHLNVNKNRKKGGNAPHQPILLLAVIDLIANQKITHTKIYPSDTLVKKYKYYWRLLNTTKYNPKISLPFFHLKNHQEKFWKIHYSSNYDGGRPETINRLREDIAYAEIDMELFDLIQDPENCKELIDSLINAWFSSQYDIGESLQKIEKNIFVELNKNSQNLHSKTTKESLVRSSVFRKAVLHLYDCKCALCGLKVELGDFSLVEGAHIKPFAIFLDNRISNGISLCRNHHWSFDKGLFGIDSSYKIIVSKKIQEYSPNSKSLKQFCGESIELPANSKYNPDLSALSWHRKNIFSEV